MKPEVSIIIPSYNVASLLPEAVQSVIEQPFQDWEIIIVNDGSKDNTGRVADNLASMDPRIRVIHQANKGLAGARNAGISAAKTDYILPLDADNKITEAYLLKGLPILQRNPEVHMVYGDVLFFGAREKIKIRDAYSFDKMLKKNYIDACAIYKKSLWEAIGGYDGLMPAMGFEDWDFWITAQVKGFRFLYLPGIAFYYRYSDSSMLQTTTRGRSKAIRNYMYDKHRIELEKSIGKDRALWIITAGLTEGNKKKKWVKKIINKIKLILGIRKNNLIGYSLKP